MRSQEATSRKKILALLQRHPKSVLREDTRSLASHAPGRAAPAGLSRICSWILAGGHLLLLLLNIVWSRAGAQESPGVVLRR
jgi:hypothetical protein